MANPFGGRLRQTNKGAAHGKSETVMKPPREPVSFEVNLMMTQLVISVHMIEELRQAIRQIISFMDNAFGSNAVDAETAKFIEGVNKLIQGIEPAGLAAGLTFALAGDIFLQAVERTTVAHVHTHGPNCPHGHNAGTTTTEEVAPPFIPTRGSKLVN